MSLSLEDLARGIAAGDRLALARALSLAERDPAAAAALIACHADRLGRAHVIGITGPPGAGKSTLVGVLLRRLLQSGQRIAVLAVDPSSPVSGGALLGDRFRIGEADNDGRCFIRSTATRGSLGGLTGAARQMVQLMDVAGFDLVLVETVGTGQSEIDVAQLADSLLVVFPPGLGDEMQAIKAGILELADLLVVTKCDTAGATQACQALQAVAPLWRNAPPIYPVSALSGEGVASLADVILGRASAAQLSARTASRATAAVPEELMAVFERLWLELDNRLPFRPTGGLCVERLEGGGEWLALGLRVLVSVRPNGDSFQLGAVAGALLVLAAEWSLNCRIEHIDLEAGRMIVQLQRAGNSA